MKSANETNFGRLKDGERFVFDRSKMSGPCAANRPVEECIKVGCGLVGTHGWFRTVRYNDLYLCDRSDPVIRR